MPVLSEVAAHPKIDFGFRGDCVRLEIVIVDLKIELGVLEVAGGFVVDFATVFLAPNITKKLNQLPGFGRSHLPFL